MRFVSEACVGLQYRGQPFRGAPGVVACRDELLEVGRDLPFVPRGDERVDVGEVLVQRRPPDPSVLRDLRHRHPAQPVPCHQRRHGVDRGIAHRTAMPCHRVGPQPGHSTSVDDVTLALHIVIA